MALFQLSWNCLINVSTFPTFLLFSSLPIPPSLRSSRSPRPPLLQLVLRLRRIPPQPRERVEGLAGAVGGGQVARGFADEEEAQQHCSAHENLHHTGQQKGLPSGSKGGDRRMRRAGRKMKRLCCLFARQRWCILAGRESQGDAWADCWVLKTQGALAESCTQHP